MAHKSNTINDIHQNGLIAVVHGQELAGRLLRAGISGQKDHVEARKRSLFRRGGGRSLAAGCDSSTFPPVNYLNFGQRVHF